MSQRKIKNLLCEASNPNCEPRRRQAILTQLLSACSSVHIKQQDTCEEGIRIVLRTLFENTLEHRPGKLRSLFPAFAVMCGKRKPDRIIAKVDWSLA